MWVCKVIYYISYIYTNLYMSLTFQPQGLTLWSIKRNPYVFTEPQYFIVYHDYLPKKLKSRMQNRQDRP
jgi:hypothetical protein